MLLQRGSVSYRGCGGDRQRFEPDEDRGHRIHRQLRLKERPDRRGRRRAAPLQRHDERHQPLLVAALLALRDDDRGGDLLVLSQGGLHRAEHHRVAPDLDLQHGAVGFKQSPARQAGARHTKAVGVWQTQPSAKVKRWCSP